MSSTRGLFALCTLTMCAGLAASATGCVVDEPTGGPPHELDQAIVYGNDDRLEVYQSPDPVLRDIAKVSALAVVPLARFSRNANGDLSIFAQDLADSFNICPDQRFATELSAADCSAVLIDDDLVLTAAHCFETDDDCAHYAFMFDYFYRGDHDPEPLAWADIYGCRRMVSRTLTPRGVVPRIDYAVLQLDRVPVGRTPVQVRTTPLALGEETAVIGCPSGLPLKIDTGGEVLATRAPDLDYFQLDSDTFQGSSGSGVFDKDGALIGTQVRGGEDYVPIADAACSVPVVVTTFQHDAGESAIKIAADGGMVQEIDSEEATYVRRAIDGVCSAGWPSERLCSTTARCGDGYCSLGETRASCAVDCGCAYGACLDGGNYPSASAGSRVIEKTRAEGGGCSVSTGGKRSALDLLTLLVGLAALGARRRQRARVRCS